MGFAQWILMEQDAISKMTPDEKLKAAYEAGKRSQMGIINSLAGKLGGMTTQRNRQKDAISEIQDEMRVLSIFDTVNND